jgi:superfamily II DNA/RNA helicase
LNSRYQAVFASPEMVLRHPEFQKVIWSDTLKSRLIMAVIDEAHCIDQLGDEFRKDYAQLSTLRPLLPSGTPVMAASATLSNDALAIVKGSLVIDSDSCFELNLGNDRHNITTCWFEMANAHDYAALPAHLTLNSSAIDHRKTVIFCNTRDQTKELKRFLQERAHPDLHDAIDNFHALRSRRDKRKVLERFACGEIKILVATEAAGMVRYFLILLPPEVLILSLQGTDIPDIEVGIQFGVPSSLTVFKQRIGRITRSPDIQGRAILLVEASVFEKRKKRKKKNLHESENCAAPVLAPAPSPHEGDPELVASMEGTAADKSGGDDSPEEDMEDVLPTNGKTRADKIRRVLGEEEEWCKTVQPAMRGWIVEEYCERDYSDAYFRNPPTRKGKDLVFNDADYSLMRLCSAVGSMLRPKTCFDI